MYWGKVRLNLLYAIFVIVASISSGDAATTEVPNPILGKLPVEFGSARLGPE